VDARRRASIAVVYASTENETLKTQVRHAVRAILPLTSWHASVDLLLSSTEAINDFHLIRRPSGFSATLRQRGNRLKLATSPV
jgi:hypothetical protein